MISKIAKILSFCIERVKVQATRMKEAATRGRLLTKPGGGGLAFDKSVRFDDVPVSE